MVLSSVPFHRFHRFHRTKRTVRWRGLDGIDVLRRRLRVRRRERCGLLRTGERERGRWGEARGKWMNISCVRNGFFDGDEHYRHEKKTHFSRFVVGEVGSSCLVSSTCFCPRHSRPIRCSFLSRDGRASRVLHAFKDPKPSRGLGADVVRLLCFVHAVMFFAVAPARLCVPTSCQY